MCKMNVNLIYLFFVKNTQRKGLFIMSKKLVAFFSASGTTKKVAEMIAEEVKADLFEIEPKVPYTKPDLDWMNKKSRSSVEMSDKKYRPAIMKKEMDMSSYDEILLGFPSSLKYYRHMEAILIPYRNTLKNKEKGNVGTDRKQGSQK